MTQHIKVEGRMTLPLCRLLMRDMCWRAVPTLTQYPQGRKARSQSITPSCPLPIGECSQIDSPKLHNSLILNKVLA